MSTIVNRNGIWQARFLDNNGKQCRATTGIKVKGGKGLTAAEAKKVALAVAEGMEAGVRGVASQRVMQTLQTKLEAVGVTRKVTVREWLKEFEGTPEFKRNQEIQQKQQVRIYAVFCDWLGKRADEPISKIKSTDIVEFLNYLASEHLFAKGTVNRYRFGLSVAFNSAEHHELINRNPTRTIKVNMIENDRDKEEVLPFTKEQIQVLRENLPTDLRRLMMVCLYSVGQRLSDCCRMEWSMFKLTDDGGTLTFSTGKTSRPMVIPVSDSFKELLAEIKADQAKEGIITPYLFPKWAKVKKKSGVSHAFTVQLRRLGMVPKLEKIGDPESKGKGKARHRNPLCFHSLRHYVVSMLSSEQKFSPDIIRESVGHSTEAARLCYVSTDMARRKEVSEFIGSELAS